MTVLEEILEAIQLTTAAVALFQNLLGLFGGNKDKAQAVTIAAISHPALAPNVATLLQAAVKEAHQVN
jgi:hypothetical protein